MRHNAAHHFAPVGRAGCAHFGDYLAGQGFQGGGVQLLRQVFLHDGEGGLLLGYQVVPPALREHLDAFAAVFDLLGDHIHDAGVVQLFEGVLFHQLDLAFEKAQGVQPLLAAGAHGVANVLFQSFFDAHKRPFLVAKSDKLPGFAMLQPPGGESNRVIMNCVTIISSGCRSGGMVDAPVSKTGGS